MTATTTAAPTTATATSSVTAIFSGSALSGGAPSRGGGNPIAGLATAAAAALAIAGCAAPATSARTVPAPSAATAFAWFRAATAVTAGWRTLTLPDGTATMAVPPGADPEEGDAGTVTAEVSAPDGGLRAYFNATPKQGAESLGGWPGFRLDHLADENGRPATLLASRTGMAFPGGTGSCVEDTYTTRAAAYREFACFVEGASGESVLIVAAPAASWDAIAPMLELAVDSYTAR